MKHSDISQILDTSRSNNINDVWNLNAQAVEEAVKGKRFLVLGGAGSIGSETVKLLATLAPSVIDVVDISENGLARLIRDINHDPTCTAPVQTFCCDIGSSIFDSLLDDGPGYEFVLNFAAIKHVRCERNLPSIKHCIHTNLLAAATIAALKQRNNPKLGFDARFFSVSTDKACNPRSIMGASKALMEMAMFRNYRNSISSRFANVLFSQGSLPASWLERMEQGQPIPCPLGISRYFIHPVQAAKVSLYAAVLGSPGSIVIPEFREETSFEYLAESFCHRMKYQGGILRTEVTTSGEKEHEVFVGNDEQVIRVDGRFDEISKQHLFSNAPDPDSLKYLRIYASKTMEEIVERIQAVVPSARLDRLEKAASLDSVR